MSSEFDTPLFSRVGTMFADDELEHISARLRKLVFFGSLPYWGERRVDESNAFYTACTQATVECSTVLA